MKKVIPIILLFITIIISGCVANKTEKIDDTNSLKILEEPAETNKIPNVDLENLEANVPILIYHHIRQATEKDSENSLQFIVNPEILDQQFAYLKENNFQTISFKNLADYFEGDFTLPKKPIIISFDDGLINQYNNALPILNRYNLKATFFIFTNPIGRSTNYMTWEEIKELDESGMEIGSHGFYHLYLNKIDQIELEREVVKSKEAVKENLGHEIYAFAYPFGAYDQEVTTLIKDSGYLTSRDIVNGVTHTKKDLFKLRGYFITEDFSRFKNIINQ